MQMTFGFGARGVVIAMTASVKKISKQEFMQGTTAPVPAATVGAQWPSAPAAAGGSAAPVKPQ
ncbi:MAG TPA: hypothetical protein VFZ54_08335 [Burkholderiales bacterium]